MITPKRKREADESEERESQFATKFFVSETKPNPNRVYSCKICHKEFSTSQALGGHCTSHKNANADLALGPKKIKVHKCSICGEKFLKGQALGGHMTTHQKEVATNGSVCTYDFFCREKTESGKGTNSEKSSNKAEMLLWGLDLKLGLP